MRRVVTISDLHIGGVEHPMLGHPADLTEFLMQLASYQGDEEVELVVAGDFIDFLAEPPYDAWTASEGQAVKKVQEVFSRLSGLFDAFARCAQALARFTILLGNHDIELAYPRVREALFHRLGTGPHRCHFIHDNEAYRVGELLIEHGNRYDPWNAIDYHGLRQITSCASRGELPPRALDVCPGSQLVCGAMNPLKERYHFIDLLKPEGKILALLLLEIEPTVVKKHLGELFTFASQWVAKHYRKAQWYVFGDGVSPANERLVASGEETDALPLEIRRAFYKELNALDAQQPRNVATGDTPDLLRKVVLDADQDGLRAMFERGTPVPAERLRKLQVALRGILDGDRTFDSGFADGECYRAAKKMVETGVAKVVVMGHTHLSRNIDLAGGGRYLNTGTWADVIQVDPRLLDDTDAARTDLTAWLQQLSEDRLDGIRRNRPSYADVRVNHEGRVVFTDKMLPDYQAGQRFS